MLQVGSNGSRTTKDKTGGNPAKAAFLEKVRQSNTACQNGDFERAVTLYTEAIALDPANHILYSNRCQFHQYFTITFFV